ncbi:MAG TPA: DUF4147 domain-containing protein [Steroidobacteraceae bacterium]
MNPRRLLLEWFHEALRSVDGERCAANALRGRQTGPVALFAIGKAASSMSLGAFAALGDDIRQALIITKDGHVDPRLAGRPHVQVIECAHPVPDERSLAAGAELERQVTRLPRALTPLFLVSGGSSSLVESLRDGTTLGDLRALNVRGMASGWDIARLNAERARLSRLKYGGIARLLGDRPAQALFISDVPGDDPNVIGSGLLGTAPDREDHVQRTVVANLELATRSVSDLAKAQGIELETRVGRFDGEAANVAHEFVEALRRTSADGLVWGGESTVVLPANAGRGGRNQHLALAAARAMHAGDAFTILAAGTDGTDGPTDDAGALVDSGTIGRAELGGVDVERALNGFDSGLALEAAQDLVHTGPTGTNVGDILIGLKQNARRFRDPAPPRML